MSKRSVVDIREKKDTRGLPVTLDPRYYYEYSSRLRSQNATGIEGLLYKFIPYSFIGSLAFAIDPLSGFKVSYGRVTPANRTRTRGGQSVVTTTRKWFGTYDRSIPAYLNNPAYTYHADSGSNLTSQPVLVDRSSDTTKRTRLVGSNNGEATMWSVHISSPARELSYVYDYSIWYNVTPKPYRYHTIDRYHRTYASPAAWIPYASVETLRSVETAAALKQMQSHVLPLFTGVTAQKRTTTIFRNVVELKDLPRGIIQLRDTLKHLGDLSATFKNVDRKLWEKLHSLKTNLDDIPKEYLSYCFGWRQTYSDVRASLLAPNRVSKRLNFLMRRNGKATTYRSERKVSESVTPSVGFNYDTWTQESDIKLSTTLTRDHHIRMVVNTTFEFPDVDLPSFAKKQFYRDLGVVPTPIDLYNLVPWTWLFDWFSGFGNYLEIIQSINEDRELINWGVISNSVKGVLATTYTSKSTSTYIRGAAGPGPVVSETSLVKNSNYHQTRLYYDLLLRRDISTMLSVNKTVDIPSLSVYQQTILGALLATRTNFRR